MFARLINYGLPILIGRWLEQRSSEKQEARHPVRDVQRKKGISPILAALGIAAGALAGVVLGFLFTPKNKNQSGYTVE